MLSDGKWILYSYMNADSGDMQLYALEIATLNYKPVFPADSGLYYWAAALTRMATDSAISILTPLFSVLKSMPRLPARGSVPPLGNHSQRR